MLTKNLFIPIPSICFKNKNEAQRKLYQANNPLELKFVFALIAHAMMLRTVAKSNELSFKLSLKNLSSKKGLFGSKKLSLSAVKMLLNNIDHSYIKIKKLTCGVDEVEYFLTEEYIKDLFKKATHNKNVTLSELMGYKNISAMKAHLQIGYFECYKISFYGAVDFFNISKEMSHSNQLVAIKRILNSAKNGKKPVYYGETYDKKTRYTIETPRLDDYQFYDDLKIDFDDE
ncbi:hypothetical protein E2R68_12075 [Psychromonas sp. RZ22]|uniref:hypothetical protein n=1 Tax=Psychromonas algarum TaxID=2555643 RepID=UPI001068901A|nr:hypothetical protein [Psychromonas sp. RZ22]TEW53550.1 hypothetical protein E2R68_12075 [Psychromonas sp. RZ22]